MTSVTAFEANGRSAFGRCPFSVRIAATAASSAPAAPALALRLEHEARPERLGQKQRIARLAHHFGQIPWGHGADDGEAVPRLVVPDRVAPATIAPAARTPRPLREDLAEHLGEALRERRDREREQRKPPIARTSLSASSRRSRRSPRVVDDGREEVDGEDDRPLVVEAIDGCVVCRVEPDEELCGVHRDEPCEQLLEPGRRVLRSAPAGLRERGQRRVRGHEIESTHGEKESRTASRTTGLGESHPFPSPPVPHEGRYPLAAFVLSVQGSAVPSALITGGSSGIGLAIAHAGREGYALTLVGRKLERLEAAARASRRRSSPPTSPPRITAPPRRRARVRHGGMDVLVNSAGVGIAGTMPTPRPRPGICSRRLICAARSS